MLYNNNRDPEKVLRLMREKLREFEARKRSLRNITKLRAQKIDPKYNVVPPEGGLVVRVNAKVLDGYEPTTNRWRRIFQTAVSRDNLWITKQEHAALARSEFPKSLQQRIARYHLVDNTRGEPPMWQSDEIRRLQMNFDDGQLTGHVRLATGSGDRGFDAQLQGRIEIQSGRVSRFDVVCLGEFWGEGRYTRGAPMGRFPLAVTFTLADNTDVADRVPPQGSRGWVAGYLR